MEKKNKKGGAGKFILGAALGAAAAAVAAKFIGNKKKAKACKCDDGCKCGDDCKCEKKKTTTKTTKTAKKTTKSTKK